MGGSPTAFVGRLRWVPAVVAAALCLAVVHTTAFRLTTVASDSMAPTLAAGDRAVVALWHGGVPGRGAVVVADVGGTWAPAGGTTTVVKRVVGLPGERVACCDPAGRVLVDGTALTEAYLPAGSPPGEPFDVVVPAGRLWLMGDARAVSRDSRDALGAPGGGSIAVHRVVGTVVAVAWPPARWSGRPPR